MSIMEMSHRGKEFDAVIKKAESNLRFPLSIPDHFAVLFPQGGATTQFAAVPHNLCFRSDSADYLVTGSWGDKVFKEAQKFCNANLIWTGKPDKYTKIPTFDEIPQNPNAKYLHICANGTNHGVKFKNYPTPANKDSILVADMSSNFFSKFGVIWRDLRRRAEECRPLRGHHLRRDLIGIAQPSTRVMLVYKIHAESASLYSTPPCFAIYMCGLVFEHLLEQGGLAEIEKKNAKKVGTLYDAIDGSGGFYVCPEEKSVRSLMNVRSRCGGARRSSSRRLPCKGWFSSRGIGRSAACAPPYTTRCHWPVLKSWLLS